MNILIFVMSLLMILALLTYSRLDMYRSFVVTQGEFERYMTENERNAINAGAQQWYDWTTLSQKNGGSKKSAPKDASPKLSVAWLFQADGPTQDPQMEMVNRELLKKLITIVFGGHPEFRNALEKDPNLVDDLINAMKNAAIKLTAEKKSIKSTDGLENLELENPALQDIYYWMVKGYRVKEIPKEMAEPSPLPLAGGGDREDSTDNQVQEHVHQGGTVSLLDFITVSPSKTKIRVFLAPRALLLAIFGDPQTVDQIMQTRMEMYTQMKHEADNTVLSEQFKQLFLSRAINVPETKLDFTVTGTDPRLYEIL